MLQSVLDTTAMTEQCIVLEPSVTTQLYNVPEAEEVAEYCALSLLLKQLQKCQMLQQLQSSALCQRPWQLHNLSARTAIEQHAVSLCRICTVGIAGTIGI